MKTGIVDIDFTEDYVKIIMNKYMKETTKRERKVRRMTNRRKSTKAAVVKKFGEYSGMRKYQATTLNPKKNRP